jgi:hypothetical protein
VSIFISCHRRLDAMLRLTRFVGLTASLLFATAHAHAAALYSSLQLEPVTIDGESIHLQMRIDRPAGTGKFPTLVYNHGSTGFGIYTRTRLGSGHACTSRPERVNDFATPCFINLRCRVVLFQPLSSALAVG